MIINGSRCIILFLSGKGAKISLRQHNRSTIYFG
jgi:hypothetical protein